MKHLATHSVQRPPISLLGAEPFRAAMEFAWHKRGKSDNAKPGDGHPDKDLAKTEQAIKVFITALGKHRRPEREAGAALQCATDTRLQRHLNRSVIE